MSSSPPVLVVDGDSDVALGLIQALAPTGCPITAIIGDNHEAPRPGWSALMQQLGVRVTTLGLFALHSEKRRIVAAHPRVFVHTFFRFHRIPSGKSSVMESGLTYWPEVEGWIRACHEERVGHVVYVSTASPELFRYDQYGDHCVESMHYHMEQRIRNGPNGQSPGIQHWTILRPVSLMTVRVPSQLMTGWEDPTRVIARMDPSIPQQLIAPEDVGRIGAVVFTQGERFFSQTIDLAADSLSAIQEAETRSQLLGAPVVCDRQFWDAYVSCRGCCGQWCADSQATLVVAKYAERQPVSIDATRSLLPDLQDYRSWFQHKMQNIAASPPQPAPFCRTQ